MFDFFYYRSDNTAMERLIKEKDEQITELLAEGTHACVQVDVL